MKTGLAEIEHFFNYQHPGYEARIQNSALTRHLELRVYSQTRRMVSQYIISQVAIESAADPVNFIYEGLIRCYKQIEHKLNGLNGLEKIKMRLENGTS